MFNIGYKAALIAAGFAIVSLGIFGGYQYYEAKSAKAEAQTFKDQRDEAGFARDKALETNKQNQIFITQMQNEKIAVQTALNNLEAQRKVDSAKIDKISGLIQAQASNPENRVGLSPVIKQVIGAIQQNRAVKETK